MVLVMNSPQVSPSLHVTVCITPELITYKPYKHTGESEMIEYRLKDLIKEWMNE